MNIRGLDFVMYPVSDLARAASFYRDLLGLSQQVYSEEYQWAEFSCGQSTLALKGGEHLAQPPRGGCMALAVDDIHAAYQELTKKGCPVLNPPQDHSCCWHVDVLDPDGNRLILHQRSDGTAG